VVPVAKTEAPTEEVKEAPVEKAEQPKTSVEDKEQSIE
jgi:hypothetical protein